MSCVRPRPTARSSDRGITLTETVVMVALVGVIAASVAAAVGVVLRNERAIGDRVGNSRDTQQAVNWFPLDVQRASSDRSAYHTAADGGTPTCGLPGDSNVLSIQHDGSSVSYVLDGSGRDRQLVRRECGSDGRPRSSMRIASSLDPHLDEPVRAEVEITDQQVNQVRLVFAQRSTSPSTSSGDEVSVWASPRATGDVIELGVPGDPGGPGGPGSAAACDLRNPLDAALGFVVFVEDDAHIDRTSVTRAAGIGGTLRFDGSSIGSQGGNQSFNPSSIGLYAGAVDWAASSGQLQVPGPPSGGVILADDSAIVVDKHRGDEILSSAGSSASILAGNLRDMPPGQAFSFADQFGRLRACNARLALLPSSCPDCATHVIPWDPEDDEFGPRRYSGSGPIRIELAPGTTNVLNVGEEQLLLITGQPVWTGARLDQIDALVINVIDTDRDRHVHLAPLPIGARANRIIWNVHGVDTVTVPGPIAGTILAPGSHVHVTDGVRGTVVARSLHAQTASIDHTGNFTGRIGWPS